MSRISSIDNRPDVIVDAFVETFRTLSSDVTTKHNYSRCFLKTMWPCSFFKVTNQVYKKLSSNWDFVRDFHIMKIRKPILTSKIWDNSIWRVFGVPLYWCPPIRQCTFPKYNKERLGYRADSGCGIHRGYMFYISMDILYPVCSTITRFGICQQALKFSIGYVNFVLITVPNFVMVADCSRVRILNFLYGFEED